MPKITMRDRRALLFFIGSLIALPGWILVILGHDAGAYLTAAGSVGQLSAMAWEARVRRRAGERVWE